MSLASRYLQEMAIFLLYSPQVINTHAIFGLSLSIICSLPRDTYNVHVHVRIATYMYIHPAYVQKTKRFLFAQIMTKAHLLEVVGGNWVWLKYKLPHHYFLIYY